MKFLGSPLVYPSYGGEPTMRLEHGPFIMWLVSAMQPKSIVELGTQSGLSYLAMCEAVANAKVATMCSAITAWTKSDRPDDTAHETLLKGNAAFSSFSSVVDKPFDDALADFEDRSVDLLHLNRPREYEDLKNTFEKWKTKLSANAIVLVRDIEVHEQDFGEDQFWQEIRPEYPHISFKHAGGLGVLFLGSEYPDAITDLLSLSRQPSGHDAILDFFATHGAHFGKTLERQKKAGAQQKDAIARFALEQKLQETEREKRDLQRNLHFAAEEQKVLLSDLQTAREYPLKQLKKLFIFKLLQKLSDLESLSERTRHRFRRSAQKRDPKRSPRITRTEQAGYIDYPSIVESWQNERDEQAAHIEERANALVSKGSPAFAIVMPVYDPDPVLLEETLESIRCQSYSAWEACIADDNSTNPKIREILNRFAEEDGRFKLVLRDENGHISEATNSALEIVTAPFVAFMDHDDLLHQDALLNVAEILGSHPDAKLIYTDEDKVQTDGTRYEPHFKPDWNRDLLYSINYISHLSVFSTDVIRTVGALKTSFEGAQDYDMLLRAIGAMKDEEIHHIPKILYHRRAALGSTAASVVAKPCANEAGRRALENHLEQTHGQQIPVEMGPLPFTYRPRWDEVAEQPPITLIMPMRDKAEVSKVAVESILEKTTYPDFTIMIVDNGSIEPATQEWFDSLENEPRVTIRKDTRPFNYSALNNAAVAECGTPLVCLINNDVEVISEDWLSEMVALAMRPKTGCVGAKLYYPDGRIQHAGVLIGQGGVAGHAHLFRARDELGYFGRLVLRQEYTAVTAACMVMRRETFEEVGGLDETNLTVAFNDIDLCLKVDRAGYRNCWTPYAELFHHESLSRGSDNRPETIKRFQAEVKHMKKTWDTENWKDRAYNKNFSLDNGNFELAETSS
ncbi:GT2 family glycosyltransferase [Shimia isoporae]|uniref:GT2 family glycosyltransferase n=1 Tax=Shimia isoporae TaxID=647720 RepID=A0A4R1N1R5_9RHOB|nr:glycosyltransferase [Shimia isoporae]TCK98900.1 GT2 family glycosyltransferase [Shimia isoporae]